MGERAPFPTKPAEFDRDVRVSFSTVDGRYTLEERDKAWEYDEKLGKWIELVCLYPLSCHYHAI
jgi:hypothetical protein